MVEFRSAARACSVALAISGLLLGGGCKEEDPPDAQPSEADSGLRDGMRAIPCPDDTPELRIGLEWPGNDGRITARVVDANPIPPGIRRNDWVVEFLDSSGELLEDAEITEARAFMYAPGHNHDGIYPPEVTKLEEPGRFEVARLNLWMYGPWKIDIWVSSAAAGDDFIQIPACNDE